jgi:hypothetical protein
LELSKGEGERNGYGKKWMVEKNNPNPNPQSCLSQ